VCVGARACSTSTSARTPFAATMRARMLASSLASTISAALDASCPMASELAIWGSGGRAGGAETGRVLLGFQPGEMTCHNGCSS
jgi:hypothetical protein